MNSYYKFVKNITPIIFIKNQEERSNFNYYCSYLYLCKKDEVFSNKFKPINYALGVMDTQWAFNDQEGLKILTSERGSIHIWLMKSNISSWKWISRKSYEFAKV